MPKPSPTTPREIRVAVATEFPLVHWQARCIEALADVNGVVLERWIQVSPGRKRGRARSGSGALKVVVVPDVLSGLDVDGSPPGAGEWRAIDGVVDILLDLSTRGVAQPVSWATEVWRFRYGEGLSADPRLAALVDYVRTPGRTRVALVSEPSGEIIREGRLSWWRGEQLDRILLDPAFWPATAALDVTTPRHGDDVESSSDDGAGSSVVEAVTRRLGRMSRLPRPLLEVAAATRRTFRAPGLLTHHDDWHIGIVDASIERVIGMGNDLEVRWLPGWRGRFAADPFGLERAGVLHVFFEDFDQRHGRGTISHVAIAADGTVGEPESVLDPGVHTSYPFLVEHGGTTFLMPETAAASRLVLYESVDFPHRWQPVVTMLDGIPVVDASVVEFEGRWWMFGTRLDHGANHNLFIWHARELTGPWQPHAANPVKTDARSSRPGGTPFIVDGALYRPSQDDSLSYGGQVVVNQVQVLTPRAFVERPVGSIGPKPGSPYPDGLHTLSRAGTRTLIDGNNRHFVGDTFRRDVAALLRRSRPEIGT
jgi:hypothetical protein